MNFNGTLHIDEPQDSVWTLLTDPGAIGTCVPGLEEISVTSPTTFKAVVKSGIGPVRSKFTFDVTWQDLVEPSHARMSARGKTMGSEVRVESTMDLAGSDGGGCDIAWNADVVVHGTIASVGARLLEGFAEKQTQAFFDCLKSRLNAQP